MAILKPTFFTLLSLLFCQVTSIVSALTQNGHAKKPNILFIVTDDQDWEMDSLHYMPLLQKYMINEGTTFSNHFCTVAYCCPSRVNLWTGRTAHNTNVTDVYPPYGGYPKIVEEGINDSWLPVWMQEAGYNTYYTGKLWNYHDVDNYNSPHVKGFNGSEFLLDPYTYQYWNAWTTRNGNPPVSYKGQYSPDVIADKAYGFVHEAMSHEEPWMLTVAPVAPHADFVPGEGDRERRSHYPGVAERHEHLFKDVKVPRTPNFNPETHGGVSWMRSLPRLNETEIDYNDEFYRRRLRALQSVDEMVENLVHTLEANGLLDNTYIFFTTDNGFHISQHRLHVGKMCGFDEDIHIPLIVRGPGVKVGHVAEGVSAHTDLAPTVLGLTGSPTREEFDGTTIDLWQEEPKKRGEHINVEFWGDILGEGLLARYGDLYNMPNSYWGPNNTWKGIRVLAPEYSLYYSVWCTGEKEYYDNYLDPGQMYNYYTNSKPAEDYSIAGRPFDQIVSRLNALMMVLKSCKMDSCREPWRTLHPDGHVNNLMDALAKDFDAFYDNQPLVSFDSCTPGYIPELEGPQEALKYDGNAATNQPLSLDQKILGYKYTGPWHEFT